MKLSVKGPTATKRDVCLDSKGNHVKLIKCTNHQKYISEGKQQQRRKQTIPGLIKQNISEYL